MSKKLNLKDAVVLDWESLPIDKRPNYPPEPVGLAVKQGKKRDYLAFGHLTGGNESSYEDVRQRVGEAVESGRPLLFHNAKFDCAVIEELLGIQAPWDRVHDTLPMLFLDDPRAASFALKPAAERLLSEPPDEKDTMVEWLINNAHVPGRKLGRTKGKNYAGAYVAWADVNVGGPYAIGDVDRTYALGQLLVPELGRRGMLEAYERERQVLSVVYGMERRGVRVDLEQLGSDVAMYREVLGKLDAWLRKRLKAGPSMNLDSDDELTAALVKAKLADASGLGVTKTGKLQANKEALERGITDKQVSASLRYRAALSTCLGTFMEPWLAVAEQSGGKIFTEWHTTRNAQGEYGAKTGRLSSSPNLQNIPNEFPPLFKELSGGAAVASWPFELPPLPFVRRYIVPSEKGHILLGRDFSSQELRVLAHFEEGQMLQAYRDDPSVDLHAMAAELVTSQTGVVVSRKAAKTIAFGILYGIGLAKLAIKLGVDMDQAKQLRKAYLGTFPGIKDLQKDLEARGRSDLSIKTWGGREYYVEEPKEVNGKLQRFEYKLLNYLIQGSSADLTKQSAIDYQREAKHGHLLLTVHDEIIISAPKELAVKAMAELKDAMNRDRLDVPMLSDGEAGYNWHDMTSMN